MHRNLRTLPLLALLSLPLLAAGGCGGSDGSVPSEWTRSAGQPVVCEAAGIHPEGCGSPVPPVGSIPASLPNAGTCPSGSTCTFTPVVVSSLGSTLCSDIVYDVFEATPVQTQSFSVTYCKTTGTGSSSIAAWEKGNPSAGAVETATVDGLPVAATGFTYLKFDASPVGPGFPFPMPIVCPTGTTCSFSYAQKNTFGVPCSDFWEYEESDPTTGQLAPVVQVAYCSTAGNGEAQLQAFVNAPIQTLYTPFLTTSFPSLPDAPTAFVYLGLGEGHIGITCPTCRFGYAVPAGPTR